MESGLILLACGFVGLAIAVNLFLQPRVKPQRSWVTRDLYRGDLHALANLARGQVLDITFDQIGRLKDRGFLRMRRYGNCGVTFKGYAALILRTTVARDRAAPAERHRGNP
jgi:hypothetical protein